MPVDKFGRMSDTKTRDTGISLTYINNNYIRSDGSTPVYGSINMNGNTLTNVLDPVDAQDVATNEYVDNKKKQIIIAYASYHGDLEKDDYQFTFGGSSVKTNKKHSKYNGFMLPHSGYIKSLVFQCTGLKFSIEGSLSAFDYSRIRNKPIPLFTLVLISSKLNYIQTFELGKIDIIFHNFYKKGSQHISEINFDGFNWENIANIFATYDFSFTETSLDLKKK